MTYVEVTLNNNRKYATDDNIPYYYYKPSRITMIEPSEGPTTGGTTVMVFGIDFMPGKKIICKFDNVNTYGKYINMGQVKCLSPPNQIAGSVQLSISYEGEDDKFQSESAPFYYYETPQVYSISPPCGPVTGYTQIIVKGKNFVEMGFGRVKCIFNGTAMNATVIDS